MAEADGQSFHQQSQGHTLRPFRISILELETRLICHVLTIQTFQILLLLLRSSVEFRDVLVISFVEDLLVVINAGGSHAWVVFTLYSDVRFRHYRWLQVERRQFVDLVLGGLRVVLEEHAILSIHRSFELSFEIVVVETARNIICNVYTPAFAVFVGTRLYLKHSKV